MLYCIRDELNRTCDRYPDSDIISIRASGMPPIKFKHFNRVLELESNDLDHWKPLDEYTCRLIIEFIRENKYNHELIIQTESQCSFKWVIVAVANLIKSTKLYQEEIFGNPIDIRIIELFDAAGKFNGKFIEIFE